MLLLHIIFTKWLTFSAIAMLSFPKKLVHRICLLVMWKTSLWKFYPPHHDLIDCYGTSVSWDTTDIPNGLSHNHVLILSIVTSPNNIFNQICTFYQQHMYSRYYMCSRISFPFQSTWYHLLIFCCDLYGSGLSF